MYLPAMSRQESVRLAVMRCAARRQAERQRKSNIDAHKKEQKSQKQQKSQTQQKSKPDRTVSFNCSDQGEMVLLTHPQKKYSCVRSEKQRAPIHTHTHNPFYEVYFVPGHGIHWLHKSHWHFSCQGVFSWSLLLHQFLQYGGSSAGNIHTNNTMQRSVV